LIIFEDEAESFDDVDRNGHELADFTFFSFGTIKPFSAYGGAMTIVRNNSGLYKKMLQLNEA
jgi:dTDP-4-amino-4,6-dideoxygalactose transaminase